MGAVIPSKTKKGNKNIKTYIANHDLLTRIRLHIIGTILSAAEPTTSVVVHSQSTTTTTTGGSLLVRTRIVGVKFLIREISATTRL